jgi:protein disulfide-isomerase-like protein
LGVKNKRNKHVEFHSFGPTRQIKVLSLCATAKSMLSRALLVGIFALATTVSAFYEQGGLVEELTDANFNENVLSSEQLWVVEFYAPWCGHCKALKPKYEEAAKDLQKYSVKVGAIDCDANKKLPGMYGVRGFPTLRVFHGKPTMNPYTKRFMRDSSAMSARSARGIKNFAIKRLTNNVHPVNSTETLEGLKTRAKKRGLNAAIVVSKKDAVSPVIKGLSSLFMDRLEIGQANVQAEPELKALLGDAEAPGLVVFKHEDETLSPFSGDLKDAAAMKDFVEKHSSSERKEPFDTKEKEKDWVDLTGATLKSKISGSKDAWFVAFVHHDEEKIMDGWDEIIAEFVESGGVKVGVVRCTGDGATLCEKEGVKEKDAVKVYPYGGEVQDGERFELNKKLKAMNKARSSIPNNVFVVPAHPQAVDQVLVQAVQSKRLALVYVGDGGEQPAAFRALSAKYNRYVAFNFVGSADAALTQRFQIKSLPGMVMMYSAPPQAAAAGDAQDGSDKPAEQNLQFQMVPWSMEMNGDVQFGNTEQWLTQVIAALKPEGLPSEGGDDDGFDSAFSGSNANAPIQEISKSNFDKLCPASNRLCVIGLLDGSQTTEKMDAAIEELQLTQKSEHAMLAYSYMDGTCHTEVLNAFGINPQNLPTAVVVSRSKSKYATFFGVFQKNNLLSFVRGVKRGKRGTSPISEIPIPEEVDCVAHHQRVLEELSAAEDDGIEMDDMMAEILAEEKREKEEQLAREKAERDEEKKKKEEAKKAADEEEAKEKARKKKKRKRKKKKKKKKKGKKKE